MFEVMKLKDLRLTLWCGVAGMWCGADVPFWSTGLHPHVVIVAAAGWNTWVGGSRPTSCLFWQLWLLSHSPLQCVSAEPFIEVQQSLNQLHAQGLPW